MSLSVGELVVPMMEALGHALEDITDARNFADSEVRKLAIDLVNIQQLYAQGQIDADKAKAYLDMYKRNMANVLLAEKGMDLVAAQQVVNAIIKAVKDIVNTALGFPLIHSTPIV